MCFDKEVSNYTHKVAEEDIVCYKVVFRYGSVGKPRWSSLYQHFIYEQGELHEEKFSDSLLQTFDGQPWLKGYVYHSYSDLNGLDINEISWLCAHQAVIVKCIIPKGSIYWVIVANEVVEAFTEFRFKGGKCDEDKDCANEIGLGIRTEFVCKNCGHMWIGRKGATIDNYSEVID